MTQRSLAVLVILNAVLIAAIAMTFGATTQEANAQGIGGGGSYLLSSPIQRIFRDAQAGALMAYSVPLTQQAVGEAVLTAG